MTLPILYSFRRCPYAIRARMAITMTGKPVIIREVLLREKPTSMLKYSAKGTVPILVLENQQVIDESLDIMLWAINASSPNTLLRPLSKQEQEISFSLIAENDGHFKKWLDRYKYFDRYPDNDKEYYREQAEIFLHKLESRLQKKKCLITDEMSLADLAIFPFIRQFAFVDKESFDQGQFERLKTWLNEFLQSIEFQAVMKKLPPWKEGDDEIQLMGG